MKRIFWLSLTLCLLTIAGCGGSAGYAEDDALLEPEREDPAELESEQTESVAQLDAVLAQTEPDCSAACDLGTAICDLSARICDIANRHATDAPLQDRCSSSSERCDRSRERIAESCECP